MPEQRDKLDLTQGVEDKVAHKVIKDNAETLDGADIAELQKQLQTSEKRIKVGNGESSSRGERIGELLTEIAGLKDELKSAKADAKAARSKKNKVVSTAKSAADYRLVRDLRRNDNAGERTCCSCTRRKPSEFIARCGERCLECA